MVERRRVVRYLPARWAAVAGSAHPLSLLIGIYGLVCITGIALSGAGLSRARQAEAAGGVAVGKSTATAGLVIGIISLLLNIIWIAWVANNPYFFRF